MPNEREQVVQDDDVPQVTMQQMMSHLTTMLGMIQTRDNELEILRQRINTQNQPNVSVPYSEISLQIPIYGGKRDTDDIETWLKRVDDVQSIYSLTDDVIKLLATNKLVSNAKQWYHSNTETCKMEWTEIKNEMKDMFERYEDTATIMDKIRARKWKRGEMFEDYYYDKVRIAQRAKLSESEIISHVIKGIENFTLRTQMVCAQHKTLKSLFQSMKMVAAELNMDRFRNDSQKKEPEHSSRKQEPSERALGGNASGYQTSSTTSTIRCYKCNQLGHIARNCANTTERKPCSDSKLVSTNANIQKINFVSTASKFIKKVLVRNKTLTALVDTGSKMNLIKDSFATDLPTEQSNTVLVGLNNSRLQCDKITNLTVTIDDCIYDMSAVIVPADAIGNDVILGQAFLDSVEWHVRKDGITFSKSLDSDTLYESNMMQIQTERCEPEYQINPEVDFKTKQELVNAISNYKMSQINCHREIDDEDLQMRIELKTNKPIYTSPRRVSYYERELINKLVDDLLDKGVIRPSKSEYASPVVLVAKKNGEGRLCIDYRALNKETVKDKFPLPHIDDLINNLSNAKYFTALDLKNGFYHVKVHPESVKYTSFVVHNGQYEFVKMPFGLVNSPSVFMRYVNHVFRDLIRTNKVQMYMDDLLIATETVKENLEILNEVLNLMNKFGLQLRFDKCCFMYTELDYLGYRISHNQIKPGSEKTKVVQNFPIPKDQRHIRMFLGLTGYFRRFIKDYAITAKPLTDLLRQGTRFEIKAEQIVAMNKLKDSLTREPVLKIYDPEKEIELHTDASSNGFGAILMQKHEKKFHPIYYSSIKATESESKLHSFELELLAVINALQKFRIYLLGKRFTLVTDCNALTQTLKKKDSNPKILRWSLILQDFDFEVQHRSASQMTHVDCLSRIVPVNIVGKENKEFTDISILQGQDTEISELKNKVLTDHRKPTDFEVVNNTLMKRVDDKLLLVVPRKLRHQLVMKTHEKISHLGTEKTLEELRNLYYFRGMRKYVKKCLFRCIKCIEHNYKASKNEGFLHCIEKGTEPWRTLHMDHLGPLERSTKGHKHILAVIDAFTKFIFLEPTKTTNSEEVIRALTPLFKIFGMPRRIVTDRGTAFTSETFREFCDRNNIQLVLIAVRTPRGNGQIERYNKTIMPAILKMTTEPTKWHECLDKVQMSLNMTKQKTTNKCPSDLLLGYKISHGFGIGMQQMIEDSVTIGEYENRREIARRTAAEAIKNQQEKTKERYDKKRRHHCKYKAGELVMIERTSAPTDRNPKMSQKFIGPYIIHSVLDKDRYVIKDVPGYPVTQRPYEGILPPERMKRWIGLDEDESEEDSSEPEAEEGRAESEDEDETVELQDCEEVGSTPDARVEEDSRWACLRSRKQLPVDIEDNVASGLAEL